MPTPSGTRAQTTTRLVLDGSTLRVEVCDGDARMFDPADAAERSSQRCFRESGLGLFIVDRLADRWGIEVHEVGKFVWFELNVG